MNDIIGRRFGKLQIAEAYVFKSRKMVRCICECGGETRTRLSRVSSGSTVSCGCMRGKFSFNGKDVVHGHARSGLETPTYKSWTSMHGRCQQPTHPSWGDYGGRGIRVCSRWKKFDAFLADMGSRPNGQTLDRIDFNGDYTPENCRWADLTTQARNTRGNRNLTLGGKTQCVAAWAEDLGLGYSVLSGRLRRGWSDESALTTPFLGRGGRRG